MKNTIRCTNDIHCFELKNGNFCDCGKKEVKVKPQKEAECFCKDIHKGKCPPPSDWKIKLRECCCRKNAQTGEYEPRWFVRDDTSFYVLEHFIEQLLEEEKKQAIEEFRAVYNNCPMGVSNWKNKGKEWHYWEYFEQEIQSEFINGERCLQCGEKGKKGPLTNMCDKCLEEA